MSYITFTPLQLTNIDFTSKREIIRTNRGGAYTSTTINGCNTRKYHGLLVIPADAFDGEKHVLLSQIDETIIHKETSFHLAVRRYKGEYYEPRGNKYLNSFAYNKVPKYTYRVGNIILSRERLLVEQKQQILIKYTLEESSEPVRLQLRPFMAFRNIHDLSRSNSYARGEITPVANGISLRLYDNYPMLCMQFSKEVLYRNDPHWYMDIEYEKEKNRGYDYLEDLYTSGYFELSLKRGESVIFSASVSEDVPNTFKTRFAKELRKRTLQSSFDESLKNAAKQFVWHKNIGADIIAGFPWYGSISRQTFIALPGLRLTGLKQKLCMKVIETYLPYLYNGVFPRSIADKDLIYDTADASLWFIWCVQQFRKLGMRSGELWDRYGSVIKEILGNYRKGNAVVVTLENGLLFSADQGEAHTWMNSYADGRPVVPRYGMPVELNALWYNAVNFGLELAHAAGEEEFVESWKTMPEIIGDSFLNAYWDDNKGYLADVYNGFHTDWSVRPNMVIAAAMDYTPLSREQQREIADLAMHTLLTPRGLRTLSPQDQAYRGAIEGHASQRESATHNGAVHPWLFQFYCILCLRLHKKSGIAHLKTIIDGFKDEMTEHCLGTISEMYNGDPPHTAKGALSQAWNVAAILYCRHLISQTEKTYAHP
jgi:predicted glycogen debranching enzyme